MQKRALSFLSLLVVISLMLSACGGETPTSTAVSSEPTATTATTGGEATATTATGGGEATATTATSGGEATATTATTGGEATATTGTSGGTTGGTVGAPATTNVANIAAAGSQSTTFVRNFNPFTGSPLYPTIFGIYEPLMVYNVIKAEAVPWLADKYEWSSDNKTLTFTMHDGAKWSDGQPLTASDVAFTF